MKEYEICSTPEVSEWLDSHSEMIAELSTSRGYFVTHLVRFRTEAAEIEFRMMFGDELAEFEQNMEFLRQQVARIFRDG